LSEYKTLNSNPSTTKKKERKDNEAGQAHAAHEMEISRIMVPGQSWKKIRKPHHSKIAGTGGMPVVPDTREVICRRFATLSWSQAKAMRPSLKSN
jgi:exopolysaccharide biosynthesis protein